MVQGNIILPSTVGYSCLINNIFTYSTLEGIAIKWIFCDYFIQIKLTWQIAVAQTTIQYCARYFLFLNHDASKIWLIANYFKQVM